MKVITIHQNEMKLALEKAIEREATDEELYHFIYRLQNREIPVWLEKEAKRQKMKIRYNQLTTKNKFELEPEPEPGRTELPTGAPVKQGAYI